MDTECINSRNCTVEPIRSDMEVCVLRQSTVGFHSPGITRKSLGADAVAAHSSKTSRRAKSTEPVPLKPDDPFVKYSADGASTHFDNFPLEKRLSTMMKEQEHMSKSEVVSCYRLLMSEKLRLERFLSIITKNNEMARNRLESDLLDAMMCIEDLKQALEVRMARRRRVDPHEAEERRYLIRQNKKLLSQLYESAKKIEHLEVTRVEMKEQLELLDFQIVEVENQKAILEEELRKLPSCAHQEIQTETASDYAPTAQLMSELADYQIEQTALLARQHQLDAVVRQLRRENVDLRDQLSKLEDAENSLTESDKPWAASLQRQLEAQNERVQELECKLQAARDYSSQLESKLSRNRDGGSGDPPIGSPVALAMSQANATDDNGVGQAVMQTNHEATTDGSTSRKPHVDDLLLQETIRTFHTLLAERDQDIAQLKHQLRYLQDENPSTIEIPELPALVQSGVQTEFQDLANFPVADPSHHFHVTEEQYTVMCSEVDALEDVLRRQGDKTEDKRSELSSFDRLIAAVTTARDVIKSTASEQDRGVENSVNGEAPNGDGEAPKQRETTRLNALQGEVERLTAEVQRLQKSSKPLVGGPENSGSKDFLRTTAMPATQSPLPHRAEHFGLELQKLRDTSELEQAQSRLHLTERRIDDLEKQIVELTEEMSRARAEARSAETSLAAARRTEVALRRRLIAAMDAPAMHRRGGNNAGEISASVRHSTSAVLSTAAGDFRDTVEMQATLLSVESRNTALQEAAQLDRSRLHEQTMRIGQLEAEHRALMARLGQLQIGEATAQRSIVRLQALYEDMLREYSESRSQEMSWRPRSRSRSALKQGSDVATGAGRPSSEIARYQNGSTSRSVYQTRGESQNVETLLEGDSY